MKRSLAILSLLAACLLVVASGQASAARNHAAVLTPVTVVMHDPGCHWFSVNGKLRTTDTVRASRVRLVNLDEDALKVASRHGVRHVAVGKSLVVGHGHYVIMMVGQAADDNYLKLTVR